MKNESTIADLPINGHILPDMKNGYTTIIERFKRMKIPAIRNLGTPTPIFSITPNFPIQSTIADLPINSVVISKYRSIDSEWCDE